MLKAHRFHVKFTVHTIMSEGGDVTMEEDYTLSYRTEEWEWDVQGVKICK